MKPAITVPGLALACALLSGCQTNKLMYDWGPYEATLFTSFHEPALKAEMQAKFLTFLEQSERRDRRIAPGLFADAGTFLYERGDLEGAVRFYEMEANQWPQSQHLMTTLITSIQRIQAIQQNQENES